MPLKPSSSNTVIGDNIRELTNHGSRPRSHKQIVAIAMAEADRSGKKKRKRAKTVIDSAPSPLDD